jgi:hypothetical protein
MKLNQNVKWWNAMSVLPISEKYNAPRACSTAVSFIFAARPDRGLSEALANFGGAETLSGNVEKVNDD